jgi:REP element-mobilizing transposase RayT
MTRPLRPQFPGAVYHLTARGNDRQTIFFDEKDKVRFLKFLDQTVEQYRWLCHGYCLMTNHYHLLIETPEPNLARGMKRLNSRYCMKFNKKHSRVGYVLQGRYNSVVIQKEKYLLELCRYIVLNPVRAHMVEIPDNWKWSSYLATAGKQRPLPLLTTDWILARFGKNKKSACENYLKFVYDGIGKDGPWDKVEGGIYLGDARFIQEVEAWRDQDPLSREVPLVQRKASRPKLEELFNEAKISSKKNRNHIIVEAFQEHLYTQREIGEHLNLHPAYLSRLIKPLLNKKG